MRNVKPALTRFSQATGSPNGEEVAPPSEESKLMPESNNFDELLLWLDPDPGGTGIPSRDRGAEKYEKIRYRIINIYHKRGSPHPEEIADETAERICRKVKRLRLTYKGDPAIYFYAVAKKVFLEFLRVDSLTPIEPLPIIDGNDEELELRHAWLEHCLRKLKTESQDLILRFYQGEKREKIDNRKQLAAELGITSRALSLRALQIRQKLYTCMQGYLLGEAPPK